MVDRNRASRVYLPRRLVSDKSDAPFVDMKTDFALRQVVTERISSLPGITCDAKPEGFAAGVRRYYLESAFTNDAFADTPFATIDPAGRLSLRVAQGDTDEIIRAGWAEFDGDRILTFPPRDVMDVTVLWRIVLMAYFHAAERRDPNAWRQIRPRANLNFGGTAESPITPGAFF